MRLFVFDIDGTVTGSVSAHQSSFLKAFSDVGISEVDSDWGSYKHHTDFWIFGEVFRRNFNRSPADSEVIAFAAALFQNFETALADNALLQIPGAVNFISQIAYGGHHGYVFATGSFRQPAIRKLREVGIEFPEELLITASEFDTREVIVSEAISAARKYFRVSDFSDIVSVGDGYWDLIAAKNLNLKFIGITSGTNRTKLEAAGAANLYTNFLGSEITTKWCGREDAPHI